MVSIDLLTFIRKHLRQLLISSIVLIALDARAEGGDDLFSQIQALQNQNNFQVTGLERIQNTEKVLTSGNLEQQIKQLFAGYNHIVSRNTKGKIERIVILNKKQKRKDNRIILPTLAQGNHFTVSVALSGDGRIWQTVDMVIDTGADLVVLPESMIDQIGLADSKFTVAKMQTANGVADAKISLLKEVKIAGEIIENVEVAFIADQLLGENKLLGMSVLGRYQVNFDDKAGLVTLIRK
jgi:aspartyl protease family protein